MGNPDRRRKRAKEKAKEARRRRGTSPWEHALAGQAEYECYVNADWEEAELASFLVLRRTKGGGGTGGYAMASFLVDFLCIGLKDAFQELGVSRDEFLARVEEGTGMFGMRMAAVPIAEVRQVVAAAIRWSLEHDFRLPRDYERGVKILGGVGEVETADVSEFGTEEGGLLYVGQPRHLRARLLTETLEDFCAREDVECEFFGPNGEPLEDAEEEVIEEDEEPDMDDAAIMGVQEMMDGFRDALVTKAREWCFATGQAPQPRLAEAADALVAAMLSAPPAVSDEDVAAVEAGGDIAGPTEEEAGNLFGNLRQMISLSGTAEEQAELRAALEQLGRFTGQFKDPGTLMEQLGLGGEEEGDEEERG